MSDTWEERKDVEPAAEAAMFQPQAEEQGMAAAVIEPSPKQPERLLSKSKSLLREIITANDADEEQPSSIRKYKSEGKLLTRAPSSIIVTDEDKETIETLASEFMFTRPVARTILIAIIALLLLCFCIIGVLSAVIYSYNVQRYVNEENVLTNKKSTEPVATAGINFVSQINSETSLQALANVDRLEFLIGEGDNSTTLSLKPTGYARFLCSYDCQAKHIIHMYTSEATIIYHANETYLFNPSDSLKNTLTYHETPSYVNMTRRLFVGGDGPRYDVAAAALEGQRKLWIWSALVWVIRYRWVWVRYYNTAKRAYDYYKVYQSYYCQYDQSTGQYYNCG
jgi:hypothetical protein